MSYIRLMAVGLASYYIAAAFNTLAGSLAGAATWAAGAPVVLFGHALNIGLAVIAIFAHGVRLNMLEFSNNAGVQWAGYAYQPFAANAPEES
jgi:V/A-type H+-transporting ATPase subunit I